MVVQVIEGLLFLGTQLLEHEVMLHGNARMVFLRVVVIGEEEHVTDEGVETFLQLQTFFVVLVAEPGFHFPLGVKFRTHGIAPFCHRFQEGVPDHVALCTKQFFQYAIVDERMGHEVGLEIEAETLDFVHAERKRRRELAEQSVYGMVGNLPNAEEAQNVVDAVGREILGHLGEAAAPPAVVVLFHDLPVVGGESPVLSVDREIVGGSAGLSVEMEIMRFYPCFHAGAADADGDVPFQQDAFLARVGAHC